MKFVNKKISGIPFVSEFSKHLSKKELIMGWGRKPSYFRAKAYAEKHKLQCISLEDGFIRSLGLGKEGYPPLSLVVDESGIYFDATQSSDLEKIIQQPENQHNIARAKRAIQQILDYGITKYNQKFDSINPVYFNTGRHILVVDQTFGDQSIQYAGANVDSFRSMLKVALESHPDATIWVKVHPDVIAGKTKGHFTSADLIHPQIKICSQNYNPLELLQYVDDVYVFPFVEAADVVSVGNLSFVENEIDGTSMVFYVQPVTYIFSFSIYR